MKKLNFLLVFVCVLFFAHGQDTYRSSIELESNRCYILWGELESSKPNFLKKVFEELMLGNPVEGVHFTTLDKLSNSQEFDAQHTPKMNFWFYFQAPFLEKDIDKVALSNNQLGSSDKVFVSDKELIQDNEGLGFYADVKTMVESGQVSLLAKIDSVNSFKDLENRCKGFSLDALRGVFIPYASMVQNSIPGSFSAVVHVSNFIGKDVDGKLIARIINPETYEVVDENNNCAFARSGSEFEIEVSFLNESGKLLPGNFLLEVVLVDKENNEEIVDQYLKSIVIH